MDEDPPPSKKQKIVKAIDWGLLRRLPRELLALIQPQATSDYLMFFIRHTNQKKRRPFFPVLSNVLWFIQHQPEPYYICWIKCTCKMFSSVTYNPSPNYLSISNTTRFFPSRLDPTWKSPKWMNECPYCLWNYNYFCRSCKRVHGILDLVDDPIILGRVIW